MKRTDGAITIGQIHSSVDNTKVNISIEDKHSGLIILNGKMNFSDFAKAITGLGNVNITIEVNDVYKDIGKKKVVKIVFCDKMFGIKEQKDIVLSNFKQKYSKNWKIWNDGTNTRQDGKQHKYIIYKYIDIK